ncbi:MAG: DUF4180 domain-containing protein [Clostridia bacterium]|nr:DUF4180 domain-containing protein [Clostridia bacterium]MBO7690008.1 DUF4180 domain-containing protein [Clostridia bacterium]MBP5273001.1 DUF4180 domain-containing protein [Clostridia bacterium]MBP5459448.1 DUF4180 domain-containing protein [Clostridia bacterium]
MTVIDVKPVGGLDIAVVNADEVFLRDADTAEQLFLTVKTQGGTNLIAINQEAFPQKFWDPLTGFPGKVLDRLQQHDVKMAVVGDFNAYANGPFLDFMAECNNGFHLFFVADEDVAAGRLKNALEDGKRGMV